MHCPRCGQEQAAGNLKFCSKCGMPLTLVAEVVANGGDMPRLRELAAKPGILTRSLGLKLALCWFLVLDFLLVPLVALAGGEEIVAVIAILGFVGAMLIAVVSILFLKNPSTQYDVPVQGVQELNAPPIANEALPAAQTQSAEDYAAPAGSWKAPDTGDLVRPGSVTEGTTRLLKKEDETTE
ncbi:MAG: zinc ribbon domain-containing protein [Pyrinomonadaceae bacterium]|nr:zinc ribbon domain-containing protein [Pyrinomonadaceae bacterium]